MIVGIVFSGLVWIVVGGIQVVMDGGNVMLIFWQMLLYVLLIFGEVLVLVIGLEFVYSQVLQVMKGVVMSFWNLIIIIGNLWVLLLNVVVCNDVVIYRIVSMGLSEVVFLMFFFVGFVFVVVLVFGWYVKCYCMVDNYCSV